MQTSRRTGSLYHDVGLRLLKLLNVILVTLPFAGCWFFYYSQRVILAPSPMRSASMMAVFVVLFCYFGRMYDASLISTKRISELFCSQLLSVLMGDAFMFVVLWLMSGSFPNLLPAVAALVVQLLMSLLWCKYAHIWYFNHFAGQRTAIVYDVCRGVEDLIGRYGLNQKFDVKLTCMVEACLGQGMRMLKGMEVVFLCGIHSHDRNRILKYCVANDISAYVIPRIGDVLMSGAKRMHMFHLPMLRVGRCHPSPEYTLVKRLFDIVSSAAVILVTSPLMIGVAIAIKAQDGGPVFYHQTRLTKDGREFEILNVRCMGIAGRSARNSCAIAV